MMMQRIPDKQLPCLDSSVGDDATDALMSHTAPELDESPFNLLSNESRQMTILSGFSLGLMRPAMEKLRTCVN